MRGLEEWHTSGRRDLSIVDGKLFGIEDEFTGFAGHLDVYLDLSLVGPRGAELEVEEGEVIVGRFGPRVFN